MHISVAIHTSLLCVLLFAVTLVNVSAVPHLTSTFFILKNAVMTVSVSTSIAHYCGLD